MNTRTPETEKIAKTIGRLIANYVHGDISLANLSIQVDAQLDGARRIEREMTAATQDAKTLDFHLIESNKERDQLRNVADGYSEAWNLYKVFPSFANRRLFANADESYAKLPHVIERNKS
jgi:uncharacterized coiled-coil DUF342 family protein